MNDQIQLTFSFAELEWLHWAIQDGRTRGLDERLIRDYLQQRVEKALGIKGKNDDQMDVMT